ncbi:hypothetical protein ABFS83_02G025600 [Erythranthe nasuta]
MLRKCKRSLEMESSEEMRSFKFPAQAVPTKGLGSTNSGIGENSDVKKWELVVKYNRKQKKVEKATDPGNEGSSQRSLVSNNVFGMTSIFRITRPTYQIHDETPSEYTSIGKSTCIEKEQKDRQGCIEDPAFASKEELLPKKRVQDVRPPAEKKSKKTSSHKVAEEEYRDYLKVKASQLRQETFLLTRELQKRATMCMELTDANSLLMDELKMMYKPCVIDILEAKNPATNPQID